VLKNFNGGVESYLFIYLFIYLLCIEQSRQTRDMILQ